jgi:NAD(P)-dependent dehydrogenase (short-subunit alcohol dehydrogenase family)
MTNHTHQTAPTQFVEAKGRRASEPRRWAVKGGSVFGQTRTIKRQVVTCAGLFSLAAPKEIAYLIAFVASGNASNMTGASIPVDGRMLPD